MLSYYNKILYLKELLFNQNFPKEEYAMFKDVVYEGITYPGYQINEDGVVLSKRFGTPLAYNIINSGYRTVELRHPIYKNRRLLVHRLVVENFIRPIGRDMTINHIDGNKMNNNVSNLEIISLADNIRHAFNTGLMPVGEKNKRSIYTNDQIHEVCRLLSFGHYSITQISEMTGVKPTRVSQILAREKWKSISKHYEFPEILPVGGKNKKEIFPLRHRLMIYKLWELGYTNKEICSILHLPKTQKLYAALWDLARAKKRPIETEKFNDYPTGLIEIKRSKDLLVVQEARKRGPYNIKQKE